MPLCSKTVSKFSLYWTSRHLPVESDSVTTQHTCLETTNPFFRVHAVDLQAVQAGKKGRKRLKKKSVFAGGLRDDQRSRSHTVLSTDRKGFCIGSALNHSSSHCRGREEEWRRRRELLRFTCHRPPDCTIFLFSVHPIALGPVAPLAKPPSHNASHTQVHMFTHYPS